MIATNSPNMEERSPSEFGTFEIDEKLAIEIMSCGSSGSRSSPINRAPLNKDMYWFAHCCEPMGEHPNYLLMNPIKETKHTTSANAKYQEPMKQEQMACDGNDNQLVTDDPDHFSKKQPYHLDAYWFAQGGGESVAPITDSYNFEEFSGKDGAPLLSQKEREEKIRQFREQQEEERRRRLYELKNATVQAQKYREQLEDERRRKIEDLRLRELERRQGVEERKRMIWEAEQERKEAILRRNLEREARIEARRNAQRNSMSFAFGSSTPRTFDLDLAALGPARTPNSVVFSATSNKRTDGEVDSARRYSGADGFDRRPEDIIYFAEGVVEEAMNNQIQGANLELSSQASVEAKNRMYIGMISDAGGCVDMSENYDAAGGPKRTSQYHPYSSGCLVGSGAVVGDDPMSRSMISLSSASRARRKTDLMPALPRDHTTSRSRSPGNHGKRAVSMTRLDQLAQPRRKHIGVSMGTSNTNPVDGPRTTSPTLSSKEVPSRPRSSMSATSEQSVTSSQVSATSVKMRSGPRRVRPVSIGGVPSNNVAVSHQPQSRQGRSTERKAVTPTTRHYRAKSAEQSENKPTLPVIRRPTANQKSPKLANPTNNIPAKDDDDGADSPLIKTPDLPLSPEPDVLLTTDRQSPEVREEIQTDDLIQELSPATKPRISSEEEAKAALAEKRRLAREQAEREAELERQRQEELRCQEEERKRQEEEAQRKFEEEQIRLAELHRLQEEEKLKKAIDEQKQREEEERERLEEEMKLRVEKDEQERKAREEAERQRKELEERLRREEAERAERKKRVEQIMSRTRKSGSTPTHTSSQGNSKLSSPEEEHKPLPASSPETTADQMVEVKSDNEMLSSAQSSIPCQDVDGFVPVMKNSPTINGQDHLQKDLKNWNPFAEQSYQQENNPFVDGNSHSTEEYSQQNLSSSECLLKASDSGVILADHSPDKVKMDNIPQPNGYNHHEEDRSFTDSMSPEEKSENSVGVLLDFGTVSTPSQSQNFTQQIVSTEFEELIDIGAGTTNQNEVYLVNNADEVNSNKVPGNPFIAFEEPITRKQDNSLADLLS